MPKGCREPYAKHCVKVIASGYLLNSTQVKVTHYLVEIIDGQAFIVIVSEESAP